jgi:hypothetical protein
MVQVAFGASVVTQLSVSVKTCDPVFTTELMIRFPEPVLVTVKAWLSCGSPEAAAKVKLVSDSENSGATPVPESEAECGDVVESSVTVSVPVLVPVTVGENVTLMVQEPLPAKLVPQLFDWE